jgi:dsRNA-specific ribonuclease
MRYNTQKASLFRRRAVRIEENLAILKNVALPEKLLQKIVEIENAYSLIKEYTIPKIEKVTGYQFSSPNFFFFVFLYEEINMVFYEAEPILIKSAELFIPDIGDMKEASENRKTLAYIGDAALEIGILPIIWPPSDETIIPQNEFLHNEREKLIQNAPLSQFWDFLTCGDEKIMMLQDDKKDENKGTSMEAVFGIIYLESGLGAVENAMKQLIQHYNAGQVKRIDVHE